MDIKILFAIYKKLEAYAKKTGGPFYQDFTFNFITGCIDNLIWWLFRVLFRALLCMLPSIVNFSLNFFPFEIVIHEGITY